MRLNQDYKMALRAGTCIDKHTLRREHESGGIVFFCMAASAMVIFAVAIQSCMMAGVR